MSVVKVLRLEKLSYLEKEKDREKEKVRDRTAKLNEKNSDRELKQEIKSKGDIFC